MVEKSCKIRCAGFGAGGYGSRDLATFLTHPDVELVAVADVDQAVLDEFYQQHPTVAAFQDYRKLLATHGHELDVAIIATPDHMHAPIAAEAMHYNLAVYVQKPLTHTVYEARRLRQIASERKLVTQMGIQIHASSEYNTMVNWIQTGLIGKVTEVHVWSGNTWGDEQDLPSRSDPIPPTLDWQGWLGVSKERTYLQDYYCPDQWRRRVAFGSGTIGDKCCHLFDPIFRALELTAPVSLKSQAKPVTENWQLNNQISYLFPGTNHTAAEVLPVHWYDGNRKPSVQLRRRFSGSQFHLHGSICVGTEGALMLGHLAPPVVVRGRAGHPRLVMEAGNHYRQFLDAVLGKTKTTANFDFAGPVTEAALLGCIALQFPGIALQWDSATMTFPNHPEANQFVHKTYREGWNVPGIPRKEDNGAGIYATTSGADPLRLPEKDQGQAASRGSGLDAKVPAVPYAGHAGL